MADRYRTTISLSPADKARAQKKFDDEQRPRRIPQSMRLPAYLALLIERQLVVEEQAPAAKIQSGAASRKRPPKKRRV